MPTEIQFGTLVNIKYIYNATGQKVSKIVSENSVITTHYYQSGYQYENGNLLFFPHAEGYVNVVSGAVPTYNYVYQYKDHLGNNRLSYATTTQASQTQLTILEESHYYPFGLKHAQYNSDHYQFIPPANGNNVALLPAGQNGNYQYKYNGKEYQDELGLNMYDYGARNYDPALGRWMNIDPKAEKYFNLSPYVYVANMPTIAIDPDGKEIFIPLKGNSNSSENRKQKAQLTSSLQKLTNSKIKLVETKGGYLVKTIDGKANEGKNLAEGTKLVGDLIKSDKRITLTVDEGHENITYKSKNGDSLIKFDPTNNADGTKGNSIQNEDGTYGRPPEIGLAHELIHADANAKGEVDKTPVSTTNPDIPGQGNAVLSDKDEVNSRDRENIIRDEQKVPLRKILLFTPIKM
ncbi:RHS repeat-associated core domain-containing protein [Flavobacterium cucumis]|uniref:RHS repeat-associated core domain-containing protein n=1 Tax=Flavobacterium cucumis TaxID=416016 RepID=UPI000936E539|nr:RHS repeat-associated core domain-containing protein [Flavobacterium cucumis]